MIQKTSLYVSFLFFSNVPFYLYSYLGRDHFLFFFSFLLSISLIPPCFPSSLYPTLFLSGLFWDWSSVNRLSWGLHFSQAFLRLIAQFCSSIVIITIM